MEQVVERGNLKLAYQRVVENKGAPGVDDVTVTELKDWLKVHWPSVKQALLEGRYLPRPVRRVDIPKPAGGIRTLGVATVTADYPGSQRVFGMGRSSTSVPSAQRPTVPGPQNSAGRRD